MKNKIALLVLNLAIVTLGCNQSTSFKTSQSSEAISQGCFSSKAVDVGQLEIQGDSGAIPGQPAHYKLNQDVSCSPNQSVTWTDASGAPVAAGSTFSKSYSKAGRYVVAAQVQTTGVLQPSQFSFTTVVTPGLAVNGPEVSMNDVDNTFTLVVPAGTTVSAASWDMGDGSPAQSNLTSIDYAYPNVGTYTVTVTVTLSNGDTSVVTHSIQVLTRVDGMECINQLAITGPTSAVVGTPVSLTVFLPSCMAWRIRAVTWDFGDASAQGTSQTVSHTYTAAGTDHVVVSLYSGESTTPYVSLSTDITVTATDSGSTGGDSGGGTTTPPANQCTMTGQTRQITGEIYSEDVACGVNGHKTNSYRDVQTQTCELTGDILTWVTTSTDKQLANEGTCQGQACAIPAADLNGQSPASLGLIVVNGGYYLPDGASKTFYSTNLPDGACGSVSTTRSCSNGTLGGSTSSNSLTCASGCPGVGVSGTTQTGVVTGSEQVAHTCAFGETGIFDTYNDISDLTCNNGSVTTANTRRGSIVTAGICPTYSWVGSESWSTCSADCGGTQTRTYVCMSSTGVAVSDDHCAGQVQPMESRVCDGNPAAAAHSETTTSTQEGGGSCQMCPANQIGVVVTERTVSVTTNYACVNHTVTAVSQSETDGAWNKQAYCRDYVPHRCSQDSLSIPDAVQRYQWMKKCEGQVPAIKEFLDAFDKYDTGTGASEQLKYNGHTVYATFMIRKGKGADVVWKAPIKADAPCNVPAGIYVAAVCTASCATPDEQILVQDDSLQGHNNLTYKKFIDAWQENVKFVATMQENSLLASKKVDLSRVDYWVTELLDGNHDVLTFNMKSGGQITLTPNHPIVNDEGSLRLASDWKVGQNMVQLGGKFDEVVSIVPSVYYGKVYNVFVKSNSLQHNIVVTNGYLNGTAYFQNDGSGYINKQILRRNLIEGVLGQ
jgi:hypothetical protein